MGHAVLQEMMELLAGGHQNAALAIEMLPDRPSVTACGARFVNTTRNFLLSKLLVLREVESTAWPALQPEQYHLVKFGRVDTAAQPSPRDRVVTLSFAANPGEGPV
jgi:hypothetical protein